MGKWKLCIWGTGDDAIRLANRHHFITEICDFYIDSDEKKWDDTFGGCIVVSPRDVDFTEDNIFVIIATSKYYHEVEAYLKRQNCKDYVSWKEPNLLELLFPTYNEDIANKIAEYEKLYRQFPQMSKEFSRNVLEYIFTGSVDFVSNMDSLSVICCCGNVYYLLVLSDIEYDEVKIIQNGNFLAIGKSNKKRNMLEICHTEKLKSLRNPQCSNNITIQLYDDEKMIGLIHNSNCERVSKEKNLFRLFPIFYRSNLLFKENEEVAIYVKDDMGIEKSIFQKYYNLVDMSETKKVIVCTDDWENEVQYWSKKGYQALPYWFYFIGMTGGIDYKKICIVSEALDISVGNMMKHVKVNCGEKEMLMFYGNCQIISYISLLITSKELLKKYIIVNIMHICEIKQFSVGLTKDFFQEIDLFIYQHISKDNKFSAQMSTDVIISYLRKDARKVCIPNAYFIGYFPQTCGEPNAIMIPHLGSVAFYIGDCNIRKMTDKGMDAKDIAEIIAKDDFYSKEEVILNVEQSFKALEERERICDVRISDFIRLWYQKRQLFYTHNHPSCFLLGEILYRIFSFLGEKYYFEIDKGFENLERETFIYPSVAKALNLPFAKREYCYWRKLNTEPSDIEQYVMAYQKYCCKKRDSE